MNKLTWAGGNDATAFEIDSRSSLLFPEVLADSALVAVVGNGCEVTVLARRGSFLFDEVTVVVVAHSCSNKLITGSAWLESKSTTSRKPPKSSPFSLLMTVWAISFEAN